MKTPLSFHILLAGFSGAGKSTTLAELGRLLPQSPQFDLDQLISDDIPGLIEREGWASFRQREAAELEKALGQAPSVIALGGGTLEKGWPIIEKSGRAQVIYLDCSFEVCWERIRTQPGQRPLAQQGEESLRRLFEERKSLYARCPLRVDATRPTNEVALAILRLTGLA